VIFISPARPRALVALVALLAAVPIPPAHAAPGRADLAVTMVDAPDPVSPGKLLTYRITLDVRGDRAASSVSVQTSVPAGTTFVSGEAPPGWALTTPAAGATGNVTATFGSVPPGRVSVFQVTVLVGADTPVDTTIQNTVLVASSTTDPTPTDNSAVTTTSVRPPRPPAADLGTAIEILQEPVASSGNLVAMLFVRNEGPQAATDVVIRTVTPEGSTFAWATSTVGSVTAPEVGSTGDVTATVDVIPAGKEVILTVVTLVTAHAGGRLEVPSLVSASSTDPELSNNVARATARVFPPTTTSDLAIAIADLPEFVRTDADVTFRVVASNEGSEPIEAVTVLSPIAPGARFISAEPEVGEVRLPPPGRPGAVGWKPGSLEPGASASLAITVRIGNRSGVPFLASALGTSIASDTDTTDNVANLRARVQTVGLATIQWNPPDLSSGEATPPPSGVVVAPTSSAGKRAAYKETAPRDDADSPVEYSVYVSSSPNVQTTAENLWTTVPANQTTTTAPVAPGGSFFTVTATYPDGESSAANADGTGDEPGAAITSVKVTSSKVTAKGSGFTDDVEVLIDGINFASAAKVKGAGSKTVQKGGLSVGLTMDEYLSTGTSFLFIFRNSDGGVTTWEYEK
jgi:uncharacterized repeat protein (TIGR01451 family)